MQEDLGTKLDWVAIDQWNTDNPHVHLLVRGVDESGADLVIARDYISRGMRSRAEDLVTASLGPSPSMRSTPLWNESSPPIAGSVSTGGSNPLPMNSGCWT
jgi:type IV secretory pathway VirD2 relaxase